MTGLILQGKSADERIFKIFIVLQKRRLFIIYILKINKYHEHNFTQHLHLYSGDDPYLMDDTQQKNKSYWWLFCCCSSKNPISWDN